MPNGGRKQSTSLCPFARDGNGMLSQQEGFGDRMAGRTATVGWGCITAGEGRRKTGVWNQGEIPPGSLLSSEIKIPQIA